MIKQDWIDNLLEHWKKDYLLDFGYEMTRLYSTGNVNLITEVIEEFKYKITK